MSATPGPKLRLEPIAEVMRTVGHSATASGEGWRRETLRLVEMHDELLAALESLVDGLEGGTDRSALEVLSQARAAISKARGGGR